MRILHVVPSSAVAGVEIFAKRLALEQRERGHDPVILVPAGPITEVYDRAGLDYRIAASEPVGFRRFNRALRTAAASIGKVDIVHVHSDALYCRAARRAFPGAGIVFRCSGNIGIGFWLAARAINLWAEIGVAISEHDFEAFRRAGASQARMRLIHNGVPDASSTAEGRQRMAVALDLDPERHVVVATLARLVPLKGIDVLIRAAGRIAAKYPFVRFVVAGTGPEERRLKALSEELGVADIFRFPGVIEQTDDLLGLARIYAHPARHEPFGLAVAEAMSAGLPVVGTCVGGIVDQVIQGETGLLVPANDPEALASGLKTILDAPGKGRSMGRAGKVRHREHFSLDAMVGKVFSVYQEAVEAAQLRV